MTRGRKYSARYKSQRLKSKQRAARLCFYCLKMLSPAPTNGRHTTCTATIDHFIPLSKGGLNHQYNMVICCNTCNELKGDATPQEFLNKLQTLLNQNNYFKHGKADINKIINQVKYINTAYLINIQKNEPYYLTELPCKIGLLEELRLKFKQNEARIKRGDNACV